VTRGSEFWDRLAPHHAATENSYLDLPSIRRIADALRPPVLVVGAGQGLHVEELRRRGLECDGVDLSPEMIRYAKVRRGIGLVEADARAMPFGEGAYRSIVYATGVIDFIGDEEVVRAIMKEGRRVAGPSGTIFVAFYRLSRALEDFATRVGLLKNGIVSQREALETYLLGPVQLVAWVASRAGVSRLRAAALLLGMSTGTTLQEKAITFRLQKIFRNLDHAKALIQASSEKQPYRNEAAIRSLFQRLEIPIKRFETTSSCFLVEITFDKQV
jgi:SAM-dependent methyltransferase